jgi:hypothetical protein
VERFANPERYDVILFDSRAGLHETTASEILGLGADVFLFGLDERQTFQGYAALLAHLARFVEPSPPLPEWVERITMVQGKAPTNLKERTAFVEECKKLFVDAGLMMRPPHRGRPVRLPAAPFRDVPWENDDNISDEELDLDIIDGLREPVFILDDDRFRLFDPSRRHDLLSEHVYKSAFGSLLDRMSEVVLQNEKGLA